MSNILDTERYHYDRIKVRDAQGKARYSANNGDAVARAMLGMGKDDLIKVMKGNGLEDKLAAHAKSKNVGHFRMVLGQALRGMIKRKEIVKIKGQEITHLNQRVKLLNGLSEEKIESREKPAVRRKRRAA